MDDTRLPVFQEILERAESAEQLDALAEDVVHRTAPLREGSLGSTLGGDWLGHAVHPLATDLPLGMWTAASALDLIGGRRARPAARRLIGLGLLGAIPAALTGMSDLGRLEDPELRRVAVVHSAGNGAAFVAYAMSWRARRRDHHYRGVALGLIGAGATAFAGYLGGHLHAGRQAGTGMRGEKPTAATPGQREADTFTALRDEDPTLADVGVGAI